MPSTAAILARAAGVTRPRKRIPKQIPPLQIEYEYARQLRPIVDIVQRVFAPVLEELPQLLASAARERRDAGEGKRLSELIEEAEARLADAIDISAIESVATTVAVRTAQHNRRELGKQSRAALGIDVFTGDRKLAVLMDGFVAENVQLIKAIPRDVATDLEKIITRGVASGRLHRNIAKDIEERWAIGKRRAQLIARDQVGKHYSAVNTMRQKEIGIEAFFWRTVGDRRVRPEHVALDGERFLYSEPPSEGLPGEPILCRCTAEPDFSTVLG